MPKIPSWMRLITQRDPHVLLFRLPIAFARCGSYLTASYAGSYPAEKTCHLYETETLLLVWAQMH